MVFVGQNRKTRKVRLISKTQSIISDNTKCLIVNTDNVGSNHIQTLKKKFPALTLLMGKKTVIKYAISKQGGNFSEICSHLGGNIGLAFTNGDLGELKNNLESLVKFKALKSGNVSPVEIVLPKGLTTVPSDKLSLFQSLSIPVKLNKNCIEILSDHKLIKAGQFVGTNEASVLTVMNITPVAVKLTVVKVYEDGLCYDPEFLEYGSKIVLEHIMNGLNEIAALSLEVDYPTEASTSHSLINGYRNLLAVAMESEIENEDVKKVKALVEAASKVVVTQVKEEPKAPQAQAKAAAPAKKEASSEEEEMFGGMFD